METRGMRSMVKRERYLERIRPFYESELIKVLIGIRRCGKSVLLRQIIGEMKEKGIRDEQIIYMNFEDFKFSGIRTAQALYDYVIERRLKEEKQ